MCTQLEICANYLKVNIFSFKLNCFKYIYNKIEKTILNTIS